MSQPTRLEVEAKLYVADLAGLAERLAAAGAEPIGPRVYERNVRYDDAAGSLTPRGIVLRLRRDTRVRLTYKAPVAQTVSGVVSRYEAEVTLDDFEGMDAILQGLGFHPYMIYEKQRTTYRLGGAEVVLDELPFGNFCEVEGSPEAIENALATLGLADAPRLRDSYAALFDRVRRALGLTFNDLTFANFAGLQVPPAIFSDDVTPES